MRATWNMHASVRPVTAEEFARLPDDDYRYELVEGRIARMSPAGARHGALASRLALLLGQHVEAHDLGVVLTPAGFVLARHPDTVREPDVAFVRRDRIPGSGVPNDFWPGAPDLAVEIVSPGDRRADVMKKADEYLVRGCPLVLVVDPRQESVTVHRRLSQPVRLEGREILDLGDVVTGFACEVRTIFSLPSNRRPA